MRDEYWHISLTTQWDVIRKMNKTKQTKKNTLPSISHLKRLQKTQPSDKSNCKQVLVFTKMWNAQERQKPLLLSLSFYTLVIRMLPFSWHRGKRPASKSIIIQNGDFRAIVVMDNLTLEGIASNILNCVHKWFGNID